MNRSDLGEEGERSLSSDFFSWQPPIEQENDDEHDHDYKADGTDQIQGRGTGQMSENRSCFAFASATGR
jgi:hypothetical protein